MTTAQISTDSRSYLLPAILTGGLLAGTFDAIAAFLTFGWRMPYGIASGILGASANPKTGAGPATWILGLVLHFTIALGAATVYCVASRRLTFLKQHFIVCGIFFGIGVQLTMNLIVLPLSAVPFPVGPFTVQALRSGLFFHIILIGLPIAASLWWFARRSNSKAAAPELIGGLRVGS
jgi:hypothetical protein